MKKITRIATMTFLGAVPVLAFSGAVKDLGNGLFIQEYSQAELDAAGCAEPVWKDLVNQYVKSRGLKKEVEGAGEQHMILETPKNDWEQCFSGALNKINDMKEKINKIFALFSGDFDLMGAGEALAEKYLQQQCNAINRYTSTAVGDVTGAVNGGINGGKNTVVGGINDAIYDATGVKGGANTILNNSSSNSDPLIGGGKITSGTIKDVVGDYTGMFGSSGGNSSALDSLLN